MATARIKRNMTISSNKFENRFVNVLKVAYNNPRKPS